MIDPVTAISIATNAFGTIKRMVAAGRDVEDTLSQIGRWYGAVSDLNECQRRAENPPLFKKIVASQSVEQEAMQVSVWTHAMHAWRYSSHLRKRKNSSRSDNQSSTQKGSAPLVSPSRAGNSPCRQRLTCQCESAPSPPLRHGEAPSG